MIVGSAWSMHALCAAGWNRARRPSAARSACRFPSRRSRRGSAPPAGVLTTVSGARLAHSFGQRRAHRRLHPLQHRLRGFRRARNHSCRAAPSLRRARRSSPVSCGCGHQPLVDHDRGHAFGHGDEAAQHFAALDDRQDRAPALAPCGQQEFARLDRRAAAEQPRAQPERRWPRRSRPPAPAWRRPRRGWRRRAR